MTDPAFWLPVLAFMAPLVLLSALMEHRERRIAAHRGQAGYCRVCARPCARPACDACVERLVDAFEARPRP